MRTPTGFLRCSRKEAGRPSRLLASPELTSALSRRAAVRSEQDLRPYTDRRASSSLVARAAGRVPLRGRSVQKIKDAASEFLAHKRVAVTGVSRHAGSHGSNAVYQRLRERGYEVFAVNPNDSRSRATPPTHT